MDNTVEEEDIIRVVVKAAAVEQTMAVVVAEQPHRDRVWSDGERVCRYRRLRRQILAT